MSKARSVQTTVENQHMFAFLTLLFLIYAGKAQELETSLSAHIPGVSSTVVKFFKCTEVDGEWLLHADYSLLCFSSEWLSYAPGEYSLLLLC